MSHKDYVLPEVSLTHDEADPEWEVYGDHGHKIEGGDGHTYYRWHRPPGVHADYWETCVRNGWAEIVAAYEADPQDFYAAYRYLDKHPVFWAFKPHPQDTERAVNHVGYQEHEYGITRAIEIYPVKCSGRHRIEDDEAQNTKTELWYEFGPVDLIPGEYGNTHWHDFLLDGGCDTYEEAVTEIAAKVWEHYGNDRAVVDTPAWKNCERDYGEPGSREFLDKLSG